MKFRSLVYIKILSLMMGVFFLTSGCSFTPNHPLYKPSSQLPQYEQESFEKYVKDTKQWIEKNRVFLSDNKQKEIEANTPFELLPKDQNSPTKGVLLVHGLGDSPFYLKDLANRLVKQGFLVRTILLPGHGSKPADLILPKFEDWQMIVKHHVALLKNQVDDVWLGGFSTGANLVTSYAIRDEDIKGLFLFSPAIIPRDSLHVISPFVNNFIDWLDFDPHEQNYTRYATIAMNGVALFSKSVKQLKELLAKKIYDKPVLIVISQSDSVINSKKIVELFKNKFTNPRSQLIWYGKEKIQGDPRIISLTSSLPQYKISTFSHMGILFSPNNPYYGKNGTQLICDNGQSEEAEKKCPTTAMLWYSSFDYLEDGKIHARLTWNPYFEDLEKTMQKISQKVFEVN